MKQPVSSVSACGGCPLRDKYPSNTFVPVEKGKSLRLLVGESPGSDEAAKGKPFCGGAGRTLNVMLGKAGVKREELTVTNVICCQPPKNVFPTDSAARFYISEAEAHQAVTHCINAHLKPLLASRPWQRVDLMGEKALRFVAGKSGGISLWRGSPVAIPMLDQEKPLGMPTIHPAAIMREQTLFPIVVNDLRKSLVLPPENYILYPELKDVQQFTATTFAFDLETPYAGHPWEKERIDVVALSAKPYHAMVVPFQGAYITELKRIFANAKMLITQNGLQFDNPVCDKFGLLKHFDVEFNTKVQQADIMLMHALRCPDLPHDLEFIGSQFTSKPAWKGNKKEDEALYAARDVDVTLQCYQALKTLLQQSGQEYLYEFTQVPLAKVCFLMHSTGFKRDPSRLKEVRERILGEIAKAELGLPEELRSFGKKKRKRTGAVLDEKGKRKFTYTEIEVRETPWRSDRVKKKLLYQTWGLPEQLHPKTGKVSVDKTCLDKLHRRLKAPSSEFYNAERAAIVLTLKELNKNAHLLSGFAKEEDPKAPVMRAHPNFNPHGTNSGRLSSSDPNFQNQPKSARYMYVPSESDWELAEVDYSQIENRLTAFLANDKERLQRYIDDPDFSEHRYAAALFFDMAYEDVSKDNDRSTPYGKAKPIVHGCNYGMGAVKISNTYDMDLKEVKDLLFKWKSAIKETTEWQKMTAAQAKRQGYLVTPFQRRRWFFTSDYHSQALSFIPQSTAADIIYRAMIGLMYERIGWPLEKVKKVVDYVEPLPQPARLLLQVHDALVFEFPKGMRDSVLGTVKRVMEQPFKELNGFSIPVGIEVSDKSWGEVKKYTLPYNSTPFPASNSTREAA